MKHIWKKYISFAFIALLFFCCQYIGVKYIPIANFLEQRLEDSFYAKPVGITQNIKIICVDEKTLNAYGKFEDWSREKLADLMELLIEKEEYKPAVIGLDFLLTGKANDFEQAEERLWKACEKFKNVVVATNLVYKTEFEQMEEDTLFYDEWNVAMVEQPYSELLQVTKQGFSNAFLDNDGYIRHAKVSEEYNGVLLHNFGYQVADLYLQTQGKESFTVEKDMIRFLFSGYPEEYETVSLYDVLEGNVDTRAFKNSIVLVGAYAPGMQDAYHVAVERYKQMYGVEIHANIVESLLTGKIVEEVPTFLAAVIVALCMTVYVYIARKQKLLHILVEGIAVMFFWLIAGLLLKQAGFLLPLFVVEFGTVVLIVYFIIKKYVLEKRSKRKILKAFTRYVAPQVVKELSKEDSFEVRLSGEKRKIAVLFVDIRGFTTMSEALPPEQVVTMLNEYLELTSKAVFKNEGTLDKFIGDATMAIFNAPIDLEDYVYQAICTALDMIESAKELEQKLQQQQGISVQFGIGIHCGEAIVGNIGSERRMDYTAIGDTVNTAARLESKAKRGEILISQAVYEAVADRVEVEIVGELELKGKQEKILTYRLLGTK